MRNVNRAEFEITQAEYDRAAERAERERETPLGEAVDDLDQGVSDSFNCISGEMD
jgi:hypothetical protein